MSEIKKQSKNTVSIPQKIRNELRSLKSDFNNFALDAMMRSARIAPYSESFLKAEERIMVARAEGLMSGVSNSTLDLIWHNLKLEASSTKWGDQYQLSKEYARRVKVLCHGEA